MAQNVDHLFKRSTASCAFTRMYAWIVSYYSEILPPSNETIGLDSFVNSEYIGKKWKNCHFSVWSKVNMVVFCFFLGRGISFLERRVRIAYIFFSEKMFIYSLYVSMSGNERTSWVLVLMEFFSVILCIFELVSAFL